jgi:hypothetical protein
VSASRMSPAGWSSTLRGWLSERYHRYQTASRQLKTDTGFAVSGSCNLAIDTLQQKNNGGAGRSPTSRIIHFEQRGLSSIWGSRGGKKCRVLSRRE